MNIDLIICSETIEEKLDKCCSAVRVSDLLRKDIEKAMTCMRHSAKPSAGAI